MSLALTDSRWPRPLEPLKEVDDLLRCGICFDYFNTAVIIPQCSHNYCSFCIRKSLSYKAQCPTCCMAAAEPDLKNNRLLDELVKTFHSARRRLLPVDFDSPSVSPSALFTKKVPVKGQILGSSTGFALEKKKQFTDSFSANTDIQTPARPLTPPAKGSKKIKIKQEESSEEGDKALSEETASTGSAAGTWKTEMPSTSATKVVTKEEDNNGYLSPSTSNTAATSSSSHHQLECPACGVPIQEQHINKHLDSCLIRDEKKESLRSSGHKRKFLPKVVYNLLSDRDLKKRLKEHGLSTHGTKQQLIKRHQEFVHRYNAECDSLNPKSVSDIVKELENDEKIRAQLESSKPEKESMTFTKHQTENEMDEIHRDYRKKHKAEFQRLIDQVTKRKKTATKIKKEVEEPEQEEATAEDVPGETGEKMSVEGHANWESLKNQPCKMEALDCGRNLSLDLSEVRTKQEPRLSQSPESSYSSSSDILRDLEMAGMCPGSSDNNSIPDAKKTKQKPQHSRSSPLPPRSKRRRKK
ncbi:E3 ubiquitin-protein ligase RAD18 [Tiliqua scincoides]|uniref:E3 ubiquitin-protein ligase RAD18 n=1 Tax=Tiliqua scincoides TaxID=71010 RepID=UPI0034621A62